MKHLAFFILAAALLGVAAEPKDDAKTEVVQLLRKLNDAFVKRDVETMKRLMSDDHISIVSSGQRQSREEHLKALPDLKLTEYTMEAVKVTMPGKDVVIVTYESALKGTYKGKELPPRVTASSVWTNRNGTWLEVLYQETPLEKK